MSDNRTDLPSPNAPNFNQRLRETIQTYLGRQGNPLDRGLTLRDLIQSGIVKIRDGFSLQPGQPTVPLEPGDGVVDTYEPDLTTPPTPTNFVVASAISNIIVQHDAPTYLVGHGHLRTRLYGKIVQAGDPLPTFADATEIAQFSGTVYAYPTNPATTWRLWVRWETVDGVLSADPAGGINGIAATTGQDVSRLVQALTGPGNPFKVVTEQMTLPDGTVVPAGTYTADAFIHNGQITNAKIANLAVDNAKISSVGVDKLTAGSLSVGQYIQSSNYTAGTSGWRINSDGTAELSNAVVRGTVYANAGEFKGAIYGGNASGYQLGVGLFSGYSSGAYKLSLGDPGGDRIDWNGTNLTISSPKFKLENGNATFSGNLNAAAGSFTGSLIAATGTFSGSLTAGTVDLNSLLGETHIFNSTGTYQLTVPAGKTSVRLTVVGAGGGGGGGSARYGYAGGGGGAGGASVVVLSSTAGASVSVTVGAGGTGGGISDGPYSPPRDGTGGADTFAAFNGVTTALARGGRGGQGGGGSISNGAGGDGGAPGGENGQVAYVGTDGGYGGGRGGSTAYGTGGAGGPIAIYGQGAGNGSGYGSGGGGGGCSASWSNPGNFNYAGGNGANGYAIVEFFNPNAVVLRQELVDKGIL